MIKAIILALILIPGFVNAEDLNKSLVFEGFDEAMIKCPTRIWPEYNWTDTQVIIQDAVETLVWSGRDNSIKKLDPSVVPNESKQSVFSFPSSMSAKTMILIPDGSYKSTDELLRLGMHEFFHNLIQKNWKKSGPRGTKYPQSGQPRLYRRMLFENLKAYLISNGKDPQVLGKASFWYNKWKSEFPEEALNSADGYEGTAVYAEEVGAAIAKFGCGSEDRVLLSDAMETFKKTRGFSTTGNYFELSLEGYDIGTLSALALRFFRNDQTWFHQVAMGRTPVEILLTNVPQVPDKIPQEIASKFEVTASKMNSEIGKFVDKPISDYRDPKIVRIALPQKMLQSNLSPKYFVLSNLLPGAMILPMNFSLNFASDTSAVKSTAGNVFFIDPKNPCESSLVSLVAPSEIAINGDLITVEGKGLQGRIKFTSVKGEVGIFYCAH